MCSVNQICPRPRTSLVGLPRFPANAAHAGGGFPKGAAIMSRPIPNISGERFGRSVAVRTTVRVYSGRNTTFWECRCDCGNAFVSSSYNLRTGRTDSCEECSQVKHPERFIALVAGIVPNATGCLIWPGTVSGNGYGRIRIKKKQISTHRYAWELANGPIPNGLQVCHKRDTPICVNAEHMFLGTVQDNSDDMVSKNRQVRGEKVFGAKLNPATVIEIRSLFATLSGPQIAKRFGLSLSHTYSIKYRETWRHI